MEATAVPPCQTPVLGLSKTERSYGGKGAATAVVTAEAWRLQREARGSAAYETTRCKGEGGAATAHPAVLVSTGGVQTM